MFHVTALSTGRRAAAYDSPFYKGPVSQSLPFVATQRNLLIELCRLMSIAAN